MTPITTTANLQVEQLPESELQWLLPCLNTQPINRAEALGMITWLWLNSPLHVDWPVHLLASNVWPAIERRQFFILRQRNGLPLVYGSWAWFDEKREVQYLNDPASMPNDAWSCGDRMWFIDWIAPFGGSKRVIKKLRQDVFPNGAAWALRVKKGRTLGLLQDYFGVRVPRSMQLKLAQRLECALSKQMRFQDK